MTTNRTEAGRTAHRERQFHSARDFETSASQIGEVEPFSEQLRRKAQLIVCGNSANAEEAAEMMMMLGVHPEQPILADPIALSPTFQLNNKR